MKYPIYSNDDELDKLNEMGLPILHPNRKKFKEGKVKRKIERYYSKNVKKKDV